MYECKIFPVTNFPQDNKVLLLSLLLLLLLLLLLAAGGVRGKRMHCPQNGPQERRKQRKKLIGKWQRKMSRPGRKKKKDRIVRKR